MHWNILFQKKKQKKIRVHLQSIEFPIANDICYGGTRCVLFAHSFFLLFKFQIIIFQRKYNSKKKERKGWARLLFCFKLKMGHVKRIAKIQDSIFGMYHCEDDSLASEIKNMVSKLIIFFEVGGEGAGEWSRMVFAWKNTPKMWFREMNLVYFYHK